MYADSTAIVYSSDNTHDGNTTVNGELTVKGKLTLSQQGSATSETLEYLDIARLSKINHLIDYSAGAKTIITAGDGSTVGGVGFTDGALTGVTSINAGESDAKFSIDGNNIKLGYLTINATNDGIKFTDENRSKSFTIADVITLKEKTETLATGYHSEGNVKNTYTTLGDKLKVYDKHNVYDNSTNTWSETSLDLVTIKGDLYVADNYSTIVKEADSKFYVKGSDGSLKAANGKFTVDADGNIVSNGTLSVAGGKFVVNADGIITAGSMEAASGSKIGDLTIDGETLSNGTKSIKISELASDHDLVNDAKKGNESLYTGLGSVQTLAQGLDTKTAGIVRDTTGTATTIEGKLKVGSDGTVKINEGADQQVIIDSNGIKVGKNSSRMNDSYGFATTRDLYVGADSADDPTAAGSKFYVKGADGSIKAANGKFTVGADGDITASVLNTTTIKVGANNTVNPEFTVDENGNLISRGTLSALNGQFYFGADGLNIGNGNFTVDRTSGNVVTNGSITLKHGATTTTIEGETVTVSNSNGDKRFNLSDIADVGQNMTGLSNRIEAEETKRAQEVSRLDTAINDEKTKREQDVSRLDTAINDEKTKREQEVSRLDTAINDEKTKREQDVSRLDTAINDEKTKREQEVSRLDTAINDEKTKREQEVSRLDTAINDEKTKREQDVADLNGRVDSVNTRVDEVNSRVDNINADFNSRIEAEETKRAQEVSRLDTAINDEKTKREQEVSRLDTAINDEKTKREQEVTRLDGRIDDVNTNLGDLNDLDSDLTAHDKYTGNSSVVGGINAEAAVRREEVARLDNRIDDVNSRLNKVGAMSAAIASLKTMGYDPESPTEFSVGLGQYKGETGVALGFFHYPNKNFMINVSLSTSSGEIMGGIGATWRFGHKSPQKLLEEQRAAQAEKEIAAAEAYKAARAAKQAKNAK